MDYQEALAFLEGLTDWERAPAPALRGFNLRRVRSLLARLGEPQRGRRTVHIAGSKGKGSTAAMVASALGAAGYPPGLYTSPHLHSFCERVAFGGQAIAEADFARLMALLAPHVEAERLEAEGRNGLYGSVTAFEALTALAFLHFREQGACWQVLEVGMGGRLDATNVVDEKDLCIITALGLEHREVLGDTVAEIAAEKAAILRPGVPGVLAPQAHPEAAAAVRGAAAKLGAPLTEVSGAYRWQVTDWSLEGQGFRLWGPGGLLRELWIPLLGEHQVENAAAAVAALDLLQERGLEMSPGALAAGLAQVRWPGRLEVLGRPASGGLLVADGAHSGESARRLAEALRHYFAYRRLILVLGVGADKDLGAIARELAPLAQGVIATRSRHPRAAAPQAVAEGVAEAVSRPGAEVAVSEGVGEALAAALAVAGPQDLILVAGSLFVVAEAREALLGAPVGASAVAPAGQAAMARGG